MIAPNRIRKRPDIPAMAIIPKTSMKRLHSYALSIRIKGYFNNSPRDIGDLPQKVSFVLPLSSQRRDHPDVVISDLCRIADVDRTVLVEVSGRAGRRLPHDHIRDMGDIGNVDDAVLV